MFEFMKHVELIKKSAFKDKITKQKLITILNIIDNAQSNEGLIFKCMELILALRDEVFNSPNSALMELQQCPELIIRPYTELAIVNNSPALFNKEDPLDVRLGADSHSYSCSVKRLSDVLNAMKCETLSDIWVMQEYGKIYVTCEYYTDEFPASSLFIIDLDCHVGRWELSLIRLENCRVIFDKDKHNYLFNSIQKSGLVHIYGSGIDKDKFSIVDNPRIEGVFERQKFNGELSVFRRVIMKVSYEEIVEAKNKLGAIDFSEFDSIDSIIKHEWSLPERVVLACGDFLDDDRKGMTFKLPSTKECLEFDVSLLESDVIYDGIKLHVYTVMNTASEAGFYEETVKKDVCTGKYCRHKMECF